MSFTRGSYRNCALTLAFCNDTKTRTANGGGARLRSCKRNMLQSLKLCCVCVWR